MPTTQMLIFQYRRIQVLFYSLVDAREHFITDPQWTSFEDADYTRTSNAEVLDLIPASIIANLGTRILDIWI